jgi:CheY-like chemotaxis protein
VLRNVSPLVSDTRQTSPKRRVMVISSRFHMGIANHLDRRRPRNAPVRPLVLLIEGDEDTRALYSLALSADGFEVVAAAGPTEALRQAWEIHPDVIVTDLPIPACDGAHFLHELNQRPRTRDIPVVSVSGYVRRSPGECAERNGFTAFFPKPCPPDELAAGLRRVLDGKSQAYVER